MLGIALMCLDMVCTLINAYHHVSLTGSLVMEHPGLSATPILGKPIIFGTVFGSIGQCLCTVLNYYVTVCVCVRACMCVAKYFTDVKR